MVTRGRQPDTSGGDVDLAADQQIWAHCPRCDAWFVVEDPRLETLLLCPVDLHRADMTEVRLPA